MSNYDTDGTGGAGMGAASLESLASMNMEVGGKALPPQVTETTEFQDAALIEMDHDMERLRLSIPNRRKEAIEKEKNLRKITAVLEAERYSQKQIQQILGYHMCYDLYIDLLKKYDETHDKPPDVSDLEFN